MDGESLRSLLPDLLRYLNHFDDCFKDCRDCRPQAHLPVYVQGLLSDLDRKSVEPMALKAGIPPRTLQEFLSHLEWDEQCMRDRVQRLVAAQYTSPHSIGLIDETSFVKKGTKTPGVQRQWCGHLGKVENCVVTVHLGLTLGDFQCLLDGDLFLPESWDQDRERCREAHIPDTIVYRPKWKIALEQYDRAIANGVRFGWLTFDEHYGGKPEFLRELTRRGQKWVAEVPKNVCGWLTLPKVTTHPRRKGGGGRRPTKPRLVKGQPKAKRLDWLLKKHRKLRDQPWQQYRFDDREQGPSVWEAKRVLFHPVNEQGLPGEPLHLIVARHVLRAGECKYFLADAPLDTPTEVSLWVALTRHRVERLFQDDKSELGLDHYEGRTYIGLMRHIFLTLATYLFLMQTVKQRRGEKSGVDHTAGPPSHRQSNHHPLGQRTSAARAPRPIGQRDRLLPIPQRPSPRVAHQDNPQKTPQIRHQTQRNHSLPTARLAL